MEVEDQKLEDDPGERKKLGLDVDEAEDEEEEDEDKRRLKVGSLHPREGVIPLRVGAALVQSTQSVALCVGGKNGLWGSRNFSSSCQPGQRSVGYRTKAGWGATLEMGPRVVDVHALPGRPTRPERSDGITPFMSTTNGSIRLLNGTIAEPWRPLTSGLGGGRTETAA
eukprot:365410-Chlamydomonas_euryale.AAC.7